MSHLAKALQLALWLAFFAWLISTGSPWTLYAFALVGLIIWWANA